MLADISALLPPFAVLPAQPFLIGTPERALSGLAKAYGGTRESYREESPQQRLTLPAFALALVPVSNALYAAYLAGSGARPPASWGGPQPPVALRDHPAVDLSWHDARACCAWLSQQLGGRGLALPGGRTIARLRLPSEAEWEHAARGADGRAFPWGDTWADGRANTRESALGATTPAGAYPAGASPCGALDMAGNVWEWTASLDAPYPYDPADGRENPAAPGRRILRGGCYANPHGFARCACRFRLLPEVRNPFLGFRLAGDL